MFIYIYVLVDIVCVVGSCDVKNMLKSNCSIYGETKMFEKSV